ncbi:hypothetical protein JCM11491_000608 [Sporobolomyces phaffii]
MATTPPPRPLESLLNPAVSSLSPTTTTTTTTTADTLGTGATGSSEDPGQATRSLILSVTQHSSWLDLDVDLEGLDRSVTRSQTDFTQWLNDTMRLARGDGTTDCDGDLSEILHATQETRFGHSDRASERASPASVQLEPHGDDDDDEPLSLDDQQAQSPPPKAQSTTTGWKLLSLALSIALAYSELRRRRVGSGDRRPTRSTTRFVPDLIDHNTTTRATFSPLATPLPVAESVAASVYAIAFTTLALVVLFFFRRTPAPPVRPPPRRSGSPPIVVDGAAVLAAREQYALAEALIDSRRYDAAIATLGPILDLACGPVDKAVAAAALGRCHYRVARRDSYSAVAAAARFALAQRAFERSIRLDQTHAEPRFGLGQTRYRQGDYRGAARAFEAAIARSSSSTSSTSAARAARAHEWLAKALYRLGGDALTDEVERHLELAVSLDATAYAARAFLGEVLHVDGRSTTTKTDRARSVLSSALALRFDQPQVHARLAFIATERVERGVAAEHWRNVVATRERGRVDDACRLSLDATRGSAPYLSLYFVTPARDVAARVVVVDRAVAEYPNDDLVRVLHSIQHQSRGELAVRADQLGRRCGRFPDDVFAKGLYALSLVALGRVCEADVVYEAFWSEVGRGEDDSRRMAFLVMAFWERKQESDACMHRLK